MAYVVKAPLVQATDTSGVVQRFKKGAVLTDAFDTGTIKRLKDRGFVEEVKAPAKARPAKTDETDN